MSNETWTHQVERAENKTVEEVKEVGYSGCSCIPAGSSSSPLLFSSRLDRQKKAEMLEGSTKLSIDGVWAQAERIPRK